VNARATLYATSTVKESGSEISSLAHRLAADGVHIEPDPAEQAALAAIRSLRSGGHSLRAVAGALNKSGHRTRRGTASCARLTRAANGQPQVA
jgi:hypothetical protein